MTDIEVLKRYRECHTLAQNMGLTLEIEDSMFKLYRIGCHKEVMAKMKLTTLTAYLQGYKDGSNVRG